MGTGPFLLAQELPDSLAGDLAKARSLRWRQGNYAESFEVLEALYPRVERAFGEGNIQTGRVAMELGIGHFMLGDHAEAIEVYRGALALFRNNAESIRRDTMDCFYMIGVAYQNMGDLYRAEDYLGLAGHAAELLTVEEGRGRNLGKCRNALGNVRLRMADYAGAEEAYAQALEQLLPEFGESHPYIGALYGNLGVCNSNAGKIEQAIAFQRKSLANYMAAWPNGHPNQGNACMNLGESFLELVNSPESPAVDSARFWIAKGNALWEAYLPENHLSRATGLHNLGELEASLGNYWRADSLYRAAMQVLAEGELDAHGFPKDLNEVRSLVELYELESKRAQTAVREWEHAGGRVINQNPQVHFEQLDRIVGALRRDYRRESSQLLLSRKALEHHELAIAYFLAAGEPAAAFAFAERSRSVLLYAAQQGAQTGAYTGVPGEVLKEGNQIQEELLRLSGELEAVVDDSLRKSLQAELANWKKRLEEHIDLLEQAYPNYHELKYAGEPIALAELASASEAAEVAWLQYFFGQERLYGWLTWKGEVVFQDLGDADSLRQSILRYLELQSSRNSDAVLSRDLYRQLLFPFLSLHPEIEELILVRDGLLEYLSFAGLEVSTEHPRGRRFVIDDLAVSYAASSSVYWRSAIGQAKGVDYVGFGRTFPNGLTLGEGVGEQYFQALPFAEKELEHAQDILGGAFYLNGAASESEFRRRAPDAAVVHIATHTLYDDQRPLFSRLILSPDSSHDGMLHTFELFGMDLGADLVVLGACNTGRGEFQAGEGMMSLAQGFAYAGCPSVLMNHWPVPDQQSEAITTAFFGYLAKGWRKNAALRQAQLDYLATASVIEQDPQFWATQGLVGNIDPIGRRGGQSMFWWILLGIGILIVLAAWKMNRT